jgi:hypothetical protein
LQDLFTQYIFKVKQPIPAKGIYLTRKYKVDKEDAKEQRE